MCGAASVLAVCCSHMLCAFGCRTWNNALVGEQVIRDLEDKGAQLAQEKQEYIGQ